MSASAAATTADDATSAKNTYLSCLPPNREGGSEGWEMPAEWASHKATWMLWPFRSDNWFQNAVPAQIAFSAVIRAIAQSETIFVGVDPDHMDTARQRILLPSDPSISISDNQRANIHLVEMQYDDSWVRDTGPTFLKNMNNGDVGAVDWQFNAWGEKCATWSKDQRVASKIAELTGIDSSCRFIADFILEGGSIHVDGEGTVLTTEECLLNSNRNPQLSREDIEQRLHAYLGTSKVVWLPRGLFGDEDTNGHIDNFACFTKPGEVLLAWCDDPTDPQHEISREALQILSSQTDAKGRAFNIIKMPIPVPMQYAEEECNSLEPAVGEDGATKGYLRCAGERLAGSYVNFYIANTVIVCPSFDQPENDKGAFDILSAAFPTRQVIQVPGRSILLGGGNIHCITQQQPI